MGTTVWFLAVLGFLKIFCQGQEYIIDDAGNSDYISEPQFTDSSISFRPSQELQRTDFQPAHFYHSGDLQTSDLPVHLQQTLLQYRPHTVTQNFQNTVVNDPTKPQHFTKYVKPSTHRPNYAHLFSRENVHNSLIHQQENVNNQLELSKVTTNDLDEIRLDSEQNVQVPIKSDKNITLHSNFDKIPRHYKEETDNSQIEEYKSDTPPRIPKIPEENYDDSNEEENQNYIDDEYDEEYLDEEENSQEDSKDFVDQSNNKEQNETYEVLTMKPKVSTQENSFNDFIDTDSLDTTTQEPASSDVNTQLPVVVSIPSSKNIKTKYNTETTSAPLPKSENITNEEKEYIPDLVVSVVTSKTIVNNTIISPVTITHQPTNSPKTSLSEESSTDSWIVVASVQTSKSISGARYLPSSVVEQDHRHKYLNEPDDTTKEFESEVTENKNWLSETTLPEIFTFNSEISTKTKTSTESLIDKLDRVQSDLSSGLLAGGFKNDNIAVIDENAPLKMDTITEALPNTSPLNVDLSTTTKQPYPQVNIRKFNAGSRAFKQKSKGGTSNLKNGRNFASTTTKSLVKSKIPESEEVNKGPASIFAKAKPVGDLSGLLPPGYKIPKSEENNVTNIFKDVKPIDVSDLLPAGYKPPNKESALLPAGNKEPKDRINEKSVKTTQLDDLAALLPPGYKQKSEESNKPKDSTKKLQNGAKPVTDITSLLPPDYKPEKPISTDKSVTNVLAKAKPIDDISSLLPPGYKAETETKLLAQAKPVDDISSLLPPGYKAKTEMNLFAQAKPVDDISSLLPPGFKAKTETKLFAQAKPIDDISSLLPPGYKAKTDRYSGTKSTTMGGKNQSTSAGKDQEIPASLLPSGYRPENGRTESTKNNSVPSTNISEGLQTTAKPKGIKLVFPSRPGGERKSRLTTSKTPVNEQMNKATSPRIQKGWPVRSSTEFTGWPTPSTTPISIEKLLEAARTATTSTSTTTTSTIIPTASSTKPTTTSPKPTTPGICVGECDLAGTIKLVGGAKWVPELLDRNTKEWQILANDVQSELESLYSKSPVLNKWYQKIRIDGFSEGSVLVDYLVELSEIGQKVDTQEIKRLFHDALMEETKNTSNREGKSLNETKSSNKVSLGHFELDTKFTDFIVIPKNSYPTINYAEDNILLPQWAIAVIVIGLASLLFVIIFGVTVLVNRHKSSKKSPAPLTEDMLNELNKNHMGGFDNYAADDFYNMEDVWSDKAYEQKSYKKRTNDSIYDNSMSNLYDSWRSQWNGTYDNRYDDENPNSSHPAAYISSRRSKYDTNF